MMFAQKFYSIVGGVVFAAIGVKCLMIGDQHIKEGFLLFDWVGYPFIAFGIFVFANAFRIKEKDLEDDPSNYKLCVTCLALKKYTSRDNSVCSACGGQLEPLEGFYDRHPELRGSRKGEPDKLV